MSIVRNFVVRRLDRLATLLCAKGIRMWHGSEEGMLRWWIGLRMIRIALRLSQTVKACMLYLLTAPLDEEVVRR